MSLHDRSCHGQLDCLHAGSTPRLTNRVFKIHQKVRSYAVWYLENMGIWGTLRHALTTTHSEERPAAPQDKTLPGEREALGLRPGEWVEVKSVDEILATLGRNRKNRGLLWMTGMRKFCGKRYRVLKNVEKIVLESNGELRKMTNTVILEGVMCDGAEFCGCDRSCFHFWREAWLRRVEQDG